MQSYPSRDNSLTNFVSKDAVIQNSLKAKTLQVRSAVVEGDMDVGNLHCQQHSSGRVGRFALCHPDAVEPNI